MKKRYRLKVQDDNTVELPEQAISMLEDLVVDKKLDPGQSILLIPLKMDLYVKSYLGDGEYDNQKLLQWEIEELFNSGNVKEAIRYTSIKDGKLEMPERLYNPGDEVMLTVQSNSLLIDYPTE